MVRLSLLAAVLAFMPSIFAHPANGPRATKMGCGTQPSAEFLAEVAELASLEEKKDNSSRFSVTDVNAAATITIQTYFHVSKNPQSATPHRA